ncbi:VOC family protein [Paenibacillus sp. GCM10023252]|uniref:VOC family protein n=1 Tax=Paenibacillus sp. GCM10023252 TaxID=3252649 RepID=UPI003622C3C6
MTRDITNNRNESLREGRVLLSRSLLIENRIGSVFVHVSELRSSAEWYARLLNVEVQEQRLVGGGPVYWFELEGTGIILDSNRENRLDPAWREEMKPRFMFAASDIDEAYAYTNRRAEVYGETQDHGSMAYFTFRDPDGNALMACWTKEGQLTVDPTRGDVTSSIQPKVTGVFLDVKNAAEAARWYTDLLGIPLQEESDRTSGSVYRLPVISGAVLLLDANRSRSGEDYSILFMLGTNDIEEAYTYVQQQGIDVFTGIERHGEMAFFTVVDPDGNVIMICEERPWLFFTPGIEDMGGGRANSNSPIP